MTISSEADIFGNDPRYDGTCIPNQDAWDTYEIVQPEMPYRPEDAPTQGQLAVFFALNF